MSVTGQSTSSKTSAQDPATSKSSTDEESSQKRIESLRTKKNAAVKVLITLFPRIPKVTTVLLEFFIKRESKVSLQRDPLSHFCHEQCLLEAQDCLQKLHRQLITYQDLRDMIENLVCLHGICLRRAPETARDLGTLVRKLTIIVSELATSLEKISDVPVTDWMAVGNAVVARPGKVRGNRSPPFTEFIPKASELEAIKLLGAGGFGAVYKACYKPANMICTVKLIASERFKRPQQACIDKVVHSIIKSPFVVRYYACFSTKEAYVTVMEYLCGVDLMRVIERASFLPIDQVQVIIAQLILAVEHMHLKGFLHRDIKISNMLLLPSGHVKVIDFDTCKMCLGHFTKRVIKGYFRRTPFEFRDAESAGTVPYMAPEVLKRRPYGRACDWWSTGVVFYKLMTGRVPFRGKSKTVLRERIMTAPLRWPNADDHPHSATPAAKDMVSKLLKKNPVDRLGSKQYRDLRSHRFFKNFVWAKLRQSQSLCQIPAVLEVMQGSPITEDDEDERDTETSQRLSPTAPVATTNTKGRKLLQLEDLSDLDRSMHRPLFTYASSTFKRVVGRVKDASGSVSVDDSVMCTTNTTSSELDYRKSTAESGILGYTEYSGSTSNRRSRRASELMDVILFRKKTFGRYWGFGVNLEPVAGEGGHNFYVVESVKRGSPAERSQILEGDVVLAVNGTKVSTLPLSAIRKIMNSSGDQLVLTVLSSSPYRMINSRSDMASVLSVCGRQTMTLGVVTCSCRTGSWYGFTTVEAKAWNQRKRAFFRLHIVHQTRDVCILTRNRNLLHGDILTDVDQEPTDQLSQSMLEEVLSKSGPEVEITIAPLSPLRKVRPSSTRLQETFLTDDTVAEPSSAADIS